VSRDRVFGAGGEVRTDLLAAESRFFVGLDLGKRQDHTALAVVERAPLLWKTERDPVTWAPRREVRHFVRLLRRVALQTPYPDVVAMVGRVVNSAPLRGRSTLVVDATGVGGPVVDLLRRARLPCLLLPVMITGGDGESSDGQVWRVPKRDLIVGLQVAFQKRWLEVARRCTEAPAFREELLGMRMRMSATGEERYGGRGHDDLVLATALAWWRIRRCMPWMEPQGRIV
jgi:hypothetical protein